MSGRGQFHIDGLHPFLHRKAGGAGEHSQRGGFAGASRSGDAQYGRWPTRLRLLGVLLALQQPLLKLLNLLYMDG